MTGDVIKLISSDNCQYVTGEVIHLISSYKYHYVAGDVTRWVALMIQLEQQQHGEFVCGGGVGG